MMPEPIVLGFLVLALIYLTVITGQKWFRVRAGEKSGQQIDANDLDHEQFNQNNQETQKYTDRKFLQKNDPKQDSEQFQNDHEEVVSQEQ